MTKWWVQFAYSENLLPGTVYKFSVRLIFAMFMTPDINKYMIPDINKFGCNKNQSKTRYKLTKYHKNARIEIKKKL